MKPFPKKKADTSREHSLIPVRTEVGPFRNVVQHVAASSHPAVVLLHKGVLLHRTSDSGEEGNSLMCVLCWWKENRERSERGANNERHFQYCQAGRSGFLLRNTGLYCEKSRQGFAQACILNTWTKGVVYRTPKQTHRREKKPTREP